MTNDSSNKAWENFLFISSAETSQSFLLNKYNRLGTADAWKKSYENSYAFIYHIEQGKSFFQQAKQSPLNIQPILLFYGLVFLIKACILTTDPNYPESTAVLAHGVTTRKRKKQNYHYLEDEVKIQKNGLFPHFSGKMFHMKHLEGEKVNIKSLVNEVPELIPFLNKLDNKSRAVEIQHNNGVFTFPEDILDNYKMTKERFKEYIQTKANGSLLATADHTSISFTSSVPAIEILPFRFSITDNKYYFSKEWTSLSMFYELMIHYLLLYHLSMIARYEIEWWSELIYQKPNVEYPLIVQYLNVSQQKCLYLIDQYLFST
ncbi:YaaC family protein [Caldibacillus lycopersici]|uniref:YaaC family protein n=1 Tax=Perspicuibacillus lycopersici TaxID=1325689 RepID=A0AAE3IXT6_9BACI|nr:YaaC family protein [Perspicuibacillus lycopersici]MCU9615349.1 YaaC family protein [Perspicuibacillus lycopersici]